MTENGRNRFERRTGITDQDIAILARLPLFSGLSGESVRPLLADSWIQSFPRETLLFLQGEPATKFYAVIAGWVKLFRESEDGDESVIAVFTRGESFAEAAIFDKKVYPVSAAVVEDSRLLVVPAGSFMRRLRDDSDYALNMMAAMSRHLHQLVQQVEQLAVKSSTERLAGFLVKLCPARSGPAVIRLPMDKVLIAGRLGMQPETLSRSLAKLRALGVETRRSEITIPDVSALQAFSEGHGH